MFGNMIPPHRCQNEIAILNDHLRATFQKATEPVRMIGDEGEQAMYQDDDNTTANGCKKSRAAINGARQDRREDNNEHGIKRRLARKRALVPDSNHGQRGEKNDDAAERDLKECQVFRLRPQTKERPDKIVERVHSEKTSRGSRSPRVSLITRDKSISPQSRW